MLHRALKGNRATLQGESEQCDQVRVSRVGRGVRRVIGGKGCAGTSTRRAARCAGTWFGWEADVDRDTEGRQTCGRAGEPCRCGGGADTRVRPGLQCRMASRCGQRGRQVRVVQRSGASNRTTRPCTGFADGRPQHGRKA
jgi:hypothetical protein